LAQRSRKRGRRRRAAGPRPAATATTQAPAQQVPAKQSTAKPARPKVRDLATEAKPLTRSQIRDAEARAALTPLEPGERPWPITVSVGLTVTLGLTNLVLYIAGVKPHVSGQRAKLPEILIFSGLMGICAYGMWRLRYWAVLGFQTLLAIGLLGFSLALIKVNSIVWAVVCVLVIGGGSYLFWKLVRVLGRIQLPAPPGH
jgi:hypothetical protein